MKNILILLLFILPALSLKAQNGSGRKALFSLKNERKEHVIKIGRVKSSCQKESPAIFRLLSHGLRPKASVDLLDGSGIPLFTISDLGTLPTLHVGARFNAGIVITI
ncbi:MAG: hypothetical protein JWO09_356 [Bacteroidetes bacterium]|nr:hypothetical protein [Bacteroidota bacterium]